MTSLGRIELHAGDLDALADLLEDRIRERLGMEASADWYSPAQYAAAGYAPSVEAARKRAYRLLEKGSADATRVGRRVFLRGAGLDALGVGMQPSSLLVRTAQAAGLGAKVLVKVFLRGGCDGLNLCVPHGDPFYYDLRRGSGQHRRAPRDP